MLRAVRPRSVPPAPAKGCLPARRVPGVASMFLLALAAGHKLPEIYRRHPYVTGDGAVGTVALANVSRVLSMLPCSEI